MLYKGIELEAPKGPVSMSHSVYMDMICGQSTTQNMDWTEVALQIPWGRLKTVCPDQYKNACRLFSLVNMDYQICNGGIEQYFYNRYNEAREQFHADDGERYDIDEQKLTFAEYVKFAKEIYPERAQENAALEKACNAFDKLYLEEDAELSETIYCDEDETIIDEETGEEVPNPDYFEPYEEFYNEDYIHNATGFNDIFYAANDYLEEIFELQAQYCCKDLVIQLDKHLAQNQALVDNLKGLLPEAAFRKPSIDAMIHSAEKRAAEFAEEGKERSERPEH